MTRLLFSGAGQEFHPYYIFYSLQRLMDKRCGPFFLIEARDGTARLLMAFVFFYRDFSDFMRSPNKARPVASHPSSSSPQVLSVGTEVTAAALPPPFPSPGKAARYMTEIRQLSPSTGVVNVVNGPGVTSGGAKKGTPQPELTWFTTWPAGGVIEKVAVLPRGIR